jgi:hypothetical protein
MFLALVLAALTATVHPSPAKVGDLITLEFAAPATLDASPDYEVVSRQGTRVIVRTFQPKPFSVSGTVGGTRFHNLRVPVTSVLAENDALKPAPLAPPVEVPYPRAPFVALGIAALVAAAVWVGVWWRSRRIAPAVTAPALAPDERFRRAVLALRGNRAHPRRWADLADETRAFLAATREGVGKELTTTEVVARLAEEDRVVEDILRYGDIEKFAPAGTTLLADFDTVAQQALTLIREAVPEEGVAA